MKQLFYLVFFIYYVLVASGLCAEMKTTSTPLADLLASPVASPVARSLIKMKNAVDALEDYSFIHHQQERFKLELGPLIKMRVKFSKKHGTYLKILEGPKKGAEVIYRRGWNNNRVKVHPGSFPDITVNLSPRGSALMNGQHHSIEEAGFRNIVDRLLNSPEECKQNFSFQPGSEKTPIRFEFIAPWKVKLESVKKDEDLWSFSERFETDPYLILHINGLRNFDDTSEGTRLKVPTCYAPKTLLSLDPKTFLPMQLEIFDDQNHLYEHYHWTEVSAAPMSALDFDPSNKEYDF